ncbi:MAG: chloramphenicol acetyltransferase [Candidatus Bathyarchaeota archaeon]|nr:chloramphenicol acetyltransferase [Candidatus Bathyarchaeota archaeon]
MKTKLDIENWSRRDHYKYFGSCDDPYFGVVVNVDCTAAFANSKKLGASFFLYYMYESIKAMNMVENFRYRIIDGEVWVFDRIHASTTVARADSTFGFALFEYNGDFDDFVKCAKAEISKIQKISGLNAAENARVDVIHYTTLPWFSFTGFVHERNINRGQSIPKVAFGKFFEQNGRKLMPVSISANHGLVDAYHVSKYLEYFQAGLNKNP